MKAIIWFLLVAVLSGRQDNNDQGVSFDGSSWQQVLQKARQEVNYLVTSTGVFRCAVAASAASNLSSLYGLEGFSGCSGPSFVEEKSYRMGGILADSTVRYVENSPVFQANKTQTPLLLMSNDKDGNVPWEQGVEMFSVLRRMGKKVWLLEYPEERHSVGLKYAPDFTERLTAYFDYYLKDGVEPNWMKPGVIATGK